MVEINSILRTTLRSDEGFAERLTYAIVISVEIALKTPIYAARLETSVCSLAFRHQTNAFWNGNDRSVAQCWNMLQYKVRSLKARTSRPYCDGPFLCWLLLTLSYHRLVASGIKILSFVRLFMVEPLVAANPAAEGAPSTEVAHLRCENAML